MVRSSQRRPPPQALAASVPEPRVLRSSTAAARSLGAQTQRPMRGRKRAASDADASAAAGSRGTKQRKAPPPLPQLDAQAAGSSAATRVASPPPRPAAHEEEKEEKETSAPNSSSNEEPPGPVETPTLPKRQREASEPLTPEAAPGSGKRPARTSLGSDGSGALGGSERSASTRSLSLPSDDMGDDAPPYAYSHFGEPDTILHVDRCSFAVHHAVVARLGPQLRRSLAAARSEAEPRGEVTRFSVVTDSRPDAFGRPSPLTPLFSLRRVDRSRNRVTAHGSEMALSSSPARCALEAACATSSGSAEGDRQLSAGAATPFAVVRCLAHSTSRTSVASGASASDSSPGARASPREALRENRGAVDRANQQTCSVAESGGSIALTRQGLTRSSEDKENYPLNSTRTVAQWIHSQREFFERQQLDGLRSGVARTPEKVHIEWTQTNPAAVAAMLEFAYTNELRLVEPSRAFDVVQLCRWGKVYGRLMHICLATAIAHVLPEQWVYLCNSCWLLPDKTVQNALVEKLLDFLRRLPHSRSREIAERTHIEGLAAIMDQDLLGRIVMCFLNHVTQYGVWRNLLLMLDAWGRMKFGREMDEPPLSLVELHRQYASWDPFITFGGIEIGGPDYYVRPKTLFRFGEFSLQVRFEIDSLALIQWRIIKEPSVDDRDARIRRSDPKFVLRGELKVRFQCFRGGSKYEQIVPIRYTHSVHEYGIWKPLVKSSSVSARLVSELELRAARAVEGLPSQSETEASQQASQGDREEDPEFMRALFSGRFFVWGHRLCNLYHYLSGCSMFYVPRTGGVDGLVPRRSLSKMRSVPFDTLVLTLQSDRLRIPGGETNLVILLTALCFQVSNAVKYERLYGAPGGRTDFTEVPIVRTLFRCVRWCYVDVAVILKTLKRADRKYLLYELVHAGLRDPLQRFPRRTPFNQDENPYRECTPLVEFELMAGDDHLSPSQYSQQPSSEDL